MTAQLVAVHGLLWCADRVQRQSCRPTVVEVAQVAKAICDLFTTEVLGHRRPTRGKLAWIWLQLRRSAIVYDAHLSAILSDGISFPLHDHEFRVMGRSRSLIVVLFSSFGMVSY